MTQCGQCRAVAETSVVKGLLKKALEIEVERTGIEPVTSGLQSRRSPS